MSLRFLAAATLLAVLAVQPAWSPVRAQAATREITNIAGDVWRVRTGDQSSVLVVTADGVVVTDPVDWDSASWLEGQIAMRFGKPIKYLVYTHSPPDDGPGRASGGPVFADTAKVIAHAKAPERMDGVRIDQHIGVPTTIRTGGKTLELTPLGPGQGDDALVMVIRPENIAYVGDVVSPGRLPYRDFPGVDIGGQIKQIKTIEGLDFDILASTHGRLGTKADATLEREYLEALMAAVKAQLARHRSVDAIVRSLDTSAWSGMQGYAEWRDLNIRGMARWLKQSGTTR